MKYLIAILGFMLLSCATSQYTMFKPANETAGWKIECEQSFGKYTLKVDGNPIMIGQFGLFDNNFETSNYYNSHKIQMIGNQRTISTSETNSITLVQIRVIIDDSEATKFDF